MTLALVQQQARSFVQPGLFDGAAAIGAWPFGALEPLAYDFIMADPPWRFELRSEKGEAKSAQAQYATMSLDAIAALPVADLARENCLLWLWATAPMLPQQLEVLRAWGFTFKTSGVWVKKTVNGKTDFGTGYVLRNAHEPFLIGVRGEPKTRRDVRSVVEGQRREHSRKPDAAFHAAEKLMPGARRCELFSRQRRKGWETWGNEAGKFDTLDSAQRLPSGEPRRGEIGSADGPHPRRRRADGVLAAARRHAGEHLHHHGYGLGGTSRGFS